MALRGKNTPRLNHCRKRIVIRGGAGILGPHLIDRSLEPGNKVLRVDNLFTSANGNIERLHS